MRNVSSLELVLGMAVVVSFAVWQNGHLNIGQCWGPVNAKMIVGGADVCYSFLLTRCEGGTSSCMNTGCKPSEDNANTFECKVEYYDRRYRPSASNDREGYYSKEVKTDESGWLDGGTQSMSCTERQTCTSSCAVQGDGTRHCGWSSFKDINNKEEYIKGDECEG